MKKINWWEVLIGFAATVALLAVLLGCMLDATTTSVPRAGVDSIEPSVKYLLTLTGDDMLSAEVSGTYTPGTAYIDIYKLQDTTSLMVACESSALTNGNGIFDVSLGLGEPFTGTLEALRFSGARVTINSVQAWDADGEVTEASYDLKEVVSR